MVLSRAAAIVLRHFYLIRWSFSRIVPLFAWVAIDMVLWGFITRYLNTFALQGLDFVPTLLGAVLLWDFLTRVMQGVSMTFLEDVWSRNFLNLFATPLSIAEYLAGLVLSGIATSLIGLLVMIALAAGVFGLSLTLYGLMAVPFLLILFLFGIALGILACALVLRLGPSAEWFVWPIPALIAPLAGVFYPLSTLPAWMQAVAKALPPSYVFENLRQLARGGQVELSGLWWGSLLSLIYVLLATWVFGRVYGYAVQTGLFARYSAENVS